MSNLKHNLLQLEDTMHSRLLSAKSNYESHLINSFAGRQNNKIFSYIKSLSQDNTIPNYVQLGPSTASTDLDRATLFNKLFQCFWPAIY